MIISQGVSMMNNNQPWWQREDLRYKEDYLFSGEENLYSLATSAGTPCYVYNGSRIRENILRLHSALEKNFLKHKIFYAMKANRNPSVLTYLRCLGLTGIDCCSPKELLLARQVGFREEEITYTGTSVSDEDLAILSRHRGIFINCDSLSQIRRLGKLNPGREIGIRINPNMGLSYGNNSKLQYSGHKATKFGIYKESFFEALKTASQYGLKIAGLHCHSGWGMLNQQLPVFKELLKEISWFTDKIENLKYINLGGGLGVPIIKGEEPLDLEAWTGIIAQNFASKNTEILIEPGDYIVKDCGALLLQVTTVEQKRDKTFIYVNGGSGINLEPAYYQLPLEIAPVVLPEENNNSSSWKEVSIAGNINEAIDIFAEDIYLPPVKEGDFLAFLNAGGYGASMSSNHCMRGEFKEYFIYNGG